MQKKNAAICDATITLCRQKRGNSIPCLLYTSQEQKQLAPAEKRENPLKAAEQTTEQNENMIDGQINNTPTVGELEAKVKAGETISLVNLANAVKADKERGKPEKKPSIRAQLKADKEKSQRKPAKQKSQDLERS